MIRLYDIERSGNCYKARLLLALLGLEHRLVPVDLPAGEHKKPEFLAINPMGQVPVLIDDGLTLRDSQAILVYLARRYGGDGWLPTEAEGLARVMQWLSLAANELLNGAALARAILRFKREADLGRAQTLARTVLGVMDRHLESRSWLELERPTVADIACYPYVALAPEGQVPLDPHTSVQAWIARVEALPGYIGMQGLPRAV
jgi:glutathione S-transferase